MIIAFRTGDPQTVPPGDGVSPALRFLDKPALLADGSANDPLGEWTGDRLVSQFDGWRTVDMRCYFRQGQPGTYRAIVVVLNNGIRGRYHANTDRYATVDDGSCNAVHVCIPRIYLKTGDVMWFQPAHNNPAQVRDPNTGALVDYVVQVGQSHPSNSLLICN